MTLPKYEFIDKALDWQKCLAKLRGALRVAVDVEANSLYVYREEVCLIQVSIPGHDYIIDPFAGLDMAPFVGLLEDPHVEKVFHACEYDLILLKREYGANLQNLFDTMWAARVLGYKNMGLAAFLESHFGVELSKKYQKSDWGQRPLTGEHLEYAQKDTHYLLALRDMLAAELEEKGQMAEAQEIFAAECNVRIPERLFDPEDFWGIKGARELRPRALAVLRALFLVREEIAQTENKPPFKVLNNSVLLYLARTKPKAAEKVRNIRGVPATVREQYAEKIAQAVREGIEAEYPPRPKRKPRNEQVVMDRLDRLTDWRKETAKKRGVESDVILKRDALWAIAQGNPQTLEELREMAGLGECRLALYGGALLEVVRG